MPEIGFQGWCSSCRPDLKAEKIKKHQEKQKQKAAVANTQSKLRGMARQENKLLPNPAKEKFEALERWFNTIRRKLTGKCQCGCGRASSKDDEKYYKFSCCHLFPKNRFESIMYHPNNYVERAFWGGCHTNLDSRMDKWPTMADWENIKEKFHELAPLLTEEERANKFYTEFEKLVYAN